AGDRAGRGICAAAVCGVQGCDRVCAAVHGASRAAPGLARPRRRTEGIVTRDQPGRRAARLLASHNRAWTDGLEMSAFFVDNGFLIVSMILAAMLALSLYIPLMAGQLSLASPGFYALGGYIAAFMSTKMFPSDTGSYPVALLLLEMLIAG